MAEPIESPGSSGNQHTGPRAPVKRFTLQESERTINDHRSLSIDQLDDMFVRGTVPQFNEIEGDTAGNWLAKRAKHWWADVFIKVILGSPWAQWSGKRISTPFEGIMGGKGINLFHNRLFPVRHRFKTLIIDAEMDHKDCLRLRYPFGSVMWGLVDDLRKIEDGVFLGQMHFRFPWSRNRIDLGYFMLCALNKD